MSYFILIVSGAIIGLIVAAPIGPVNLICIRRTFAYGPLNGFLSGLGAALGDGVFAIITAFGLTAVSQLIEGYSFWLSLVGGIMMVGFGLHTFRADVQLPCNGEGPREGQGSSSLVGALVSTFALTITNPATLFGFAALFAGIAGLAEDDATFFGATLLVGGVVAGSAAWWLTITTITGIFHKHIDAKVMRRINQVFGGLVTSFGVVILGHLLVTRLLPGL